MVRKAKPAGPGASRLTLSDSGRKMSKETE